MWERVGASLSLARARDQILTENLVISREEEEEERDKIEISSEEEEAEIEP